jgi:hypothetical protein
LVNVADEIIERHWPTLRESIFSYLYTAKIVQPVDHRHAVPMKRVARPVASTLVPGETYNEYFDVPVFYPWDWDTRPCKKCSKLVCTPVMKNRRAWVGDDYCIACERELMGAAA